MTRVATRPRLAAACLAAVVLAASGLSAQNVTFWPVERPPRPLAARDVTFPPYEVRTLPNGMQIITVLHHEQPAVTMRLLVKAGAVHDPDKKRGVASLAASLLDQGTATLNAEQVADRIDSIGGLLSTGSADDFTAVNVVVMKDSFGVGLDLLADVVRHPAFSPEEIDRQKQQAISSQQVNANDPDYVASVLFDRLVYGFHPYGLPGAGTPESLETITRQDLQQFHRRYFVPNNMVLAIVGDVTREEAFAGAQRVFGSWERAEVAPWQGTAPPEPTRRIVIVDKPDSVQTEIRVGQVAIPRKHPDHLAWDLAVRVLGGEGANRLHRVLRAERGLTYGASAEMGARKQAGDFMAETDTRTETTGEALRLIIDEFSRLQRQRVSDRELADAQAYIAGSFPLTIETPNDIASQVIQHVIYELPIEEVTTYRERVLAITPDDVQRVAKAYIRPDRLSIVLVGNARAFVPQLQAVGFADFEVIPIAQLDLMSATLRRGSARVVASPSGPSAPLAVFGGLDAFGSHASARAGAAYVPVQANLRAGAQRPPAPRAPGVPARPNTPAAPAADARDANESSDLLRRVIEAKGGLAALKGVRTVIADSQTTLQMQQGTLPSTTRTYIAYPDKVRVDAQLDGIETTQVYNAGTGWVKNPNGDVRAAPPGMAAEMAVSVRRDIIPMLIAAAEQRLTVRRLPDERGRAGGRVQVLEISGPNLDRVRLLIDDEMLIAGQAYTLAGPDGEQLLSEEVFSDYRTVDGVRVPFEAQRLLNGQPVMKRTLTKVVLNEPIPESMFSR